MYWYCGRVRVTRGVKYKALSSHDVSWPLSLFSKEGGGRLVMGLLSLYEGGVR